MYDLISDFSKHELGPVSHKKLMGMINDYDQCRNDEFDEREKDNKEEYKNNIRNSIDYFLDNLKVKYYTSGKSDRFDEICDIITNLELIIEDEL